MRCVFCDIVAGRVPTQVVWEDADTLAFLDNRPLFPGHSLLIPKRHHEVLAELPAEMLAPFFRNVQLLSRAMETGLGADGSFIAVNNRVSQSVPHLHVHVVPRRRKDGLRGFFWPRTPYPDAAAAEHVQRKLRAALDQLMRSAA